MACYSLYNFINSLNTLADNTTFFLYNFQDLVHIMFLIMNVKTAYVNSMLPFFFSKMKTKTH